MKHTTKKLWGTAFTKAPSDAVIAFTAGRDVAPVPPADINLLPYDLWLNCAHVFMLGRTGVIPKSDAAKILKGLLALQTLCKNNKFHIDPAQEDVHTNIESWLTGKLGVEVAGKLHTARSRNDQVVCDMKLYMRDQTLLFVNHCIGLGSVLIALADEYKGVPIPGFTHHQHAMVTTFGHVLAGFAAMIARDIDRFIGWYGLHNLCPLGGVVSYGTSFPIDRTMTAKLLAFDGPDVSSLDAVTNRWEPEADLGFAVVTLMNHLSLIAQTLILLSTAEFGMITLSEEFSTGSSVMPQKKNPDPLEVIKGKAGFALGQLTGLLAMGKGNFIGYNRDSQWTKYIAMDLCGQCSDAPVVLAGVLGTMDVHAAAMEQWCHKGFIGTTTVMEQIIQETHMPMREAKVMVENAVKDSPGMDKIGGYQAWQNPKTIISLTTSYGGPGKNSMKTVLKKLKKKLAGKRAWLTGKQHKKELALATLMGKINDLIKETTV